MPQQNRKLLAIGLDGATLEVIIPMVKAKKLPNIARLLENASWGTLKSTMPPITPSAWASFATGFSPSMHGICDFRRIRKQDHSPEIVNGSFIRQKAFWEIASENGKKCLVFNVPMTYPPKQLNGIMISGMDAPKGSAYTQPVEIQKKLEEEGYAVDIDFIEEFKLNTGAYLDAIGRMLEKRIHAAKKLLSQQAWDLAVIVFVETDRIQHLFYSDSTRLQVEEIYSKADEGIGLLLDSWAGGPVVLMSDHGAASIKKGVNINAWLVQNNYAKLSSAPKNEILFDSSHFFQNSENAAAVRKNDSIELQTFAKNSFSKLVFKPSSLEKNKRYSISVSAATNAEGAGIQFNDENTGEILGGNTLPMGENRVFFEFVSQTGQEKISIANTSYGVYPPCKIEISSLSIQNLGNAPSAFSAVFDWVSTRAYSFGYYGQIYLNINGREQMGIVPKQETPSLEKELCEKLSKLCDPETGEKVFSKVIPINLVYPKSESDTLPDILAIPNKGYYVNDGYEVNSEKVLYELPKTMVGGHDENGFFALCGNPFAGNPQGLARIEDLAPTILYCLDLPIPKDCDGRILWEFLVPSFIQENEPIYFEFKAGGQKAAYSLEDEKIVENRLRKLGYLG